MFHHFHGGRHPRGQGSISADRFSELIEYVGRNKLLDAVDWRERAMAGRLRCGDLCVSFDDGLACQADVALPVLEAYDLRAFWFVYTSPLDGDIQRLEIYRYFRDVAFESIEDFYAAFEVRLRDCPWWPDIRAALADFDPSRYLVEFPFYTSGDRRYRFIRDVLLGPDRYHSLMDAMVAEQGYDVGELSGSLFLSGATIRDLHGSGHRIGLHSHSHPTRLESLDPAAQRYEYRTNAVRLAALVGEPIDSMSHPCNSYNEHTLSVLSELGVKIGFRSNMYPVADPTRFEFPREDHANIVAEMMS